MVQHSLQFGPHRLDGGDEPMPAAPYFLAGRKLYAVGKLSGAIEPIGAEHVVGEMGGVWAHPIKVADGIALGLADADGAPLAAELLSVTERLAQIEWQLDAGGLALRRREFVAEDQAALFVLVSLHNPGREPRAGELRASAWLKLLGCWFGGMAVGGGEFWHEGELVLGYDRLWQGRWGLAFGAPAAPARCKFDPHPAGTVATLSYPFELGPGETAEWELLLTADHERGHEGARHLFGQLAGQGERLLAEKVAAYERAALTGVALQTPDPAVDRAFALAKANLQLLGADYGPALPTYFLAGIPEYPQLFGCDTEYSVPGATAAGFAEACKSALLALADYGARACGRIPHEVTTNGRVFHPGNTQETPQFAAACWDYFRWTGDLAFLRRVYPLCKEGVDSYMPALWWPLDGLYPTGDGVVERYGMGARKLDSTCYLFQALGALAEMAEALELPDEAAHYRARRAELDARFEQDWWLEDEGMYADSLHSDMRPQFDGHWTVVLPLQLGLAADERARRSLERIEREWVNQWGLVHTREREESVWTLPTGLLALTAFRYGRPELGVRLLQNIAETARHGTLGAFKELIPIGLCFVQLWSSALYVQGLLEGALGLQPLAHLHQLRVDPCLPADWPAVQLDELQVGAHRLGLRIAHGELELTHHAGPAALDLLARTSAGGWLRAEVAPGARLAVQLRTSEPEAKE